jgi:hypothetical protein
MSCHAGDVGFQGVEIETQGGCVEIREPVTDERRR